MQNSILEQAEVAQQRAGYVEQAPGKKTACLMGQPWKVINFICENISDQMEPSQSAFTIHQASSAGLLSHFHKIQIKVGQPVLGLHILRNLTEQEINMAPVSMCKSGTIICVNN